MPLKEVYLLPEWFYILMKKMIWWIEKCGTEKCTDNIIGGILQIFMDMYIIINIIRIKLNTKVCINLCKTCDAGVINLKC